ncbi:hypothetical protein C1H46_004179 [Malus baccata]|uniref:Very-long-chain aldehyde decarbonylase CER1-like C-terminal domain-containing protein n=1 Tax=Malus baccata TaxID=106549 RepID=A0A540NGP2_MALBA|nr:hypothetical protein C1H46_004179 [Malus baccata]
MQNEGLNGGGTLFVNKHPDLRVRVVHGNTLTAAVFSTRFQRMTRKFSMFIFEDDDDCVMLTLSMERFQKIQKEAPADCQQYLVQVTKYQAAQNFKRNASVQYTMDRGVVYACHAGGVVHYLEGWTHHEVGALDVDRIDLVWNVALNHGLKPLSSKPG